MALSGETGFYAYSVTVGTETPISVPVEINGIPAVRVRISVEDAGVRFRYDGQGDPSPESGHYLQVGRSMTLDAPENLRHLRVVGQYGVAQLFITLEKA